MDISPDSDIHSQLKKYYQNSFRYRDDLITHDEEFIEPFLILIERYIKKPAWILDLGCGTGLSTRLLNQRGYHATGVDLSPLFLAVEKQKSPDNDLLTANASQLPFPDEAFDAAVALGIG